MRYNKLAQLQKVYSSRQVMRSRGFKLYDETLFHKLLQLRSEIANVLDIPEYLIFQYKTLLDMAQIMPTDFYTLRRIWGVSNWGLNKYGFAFLATIQAHREGKQ